MYCRGEFCPASFLLMKLPPWIAPGGSASWAASERLGGPATKPPCSHGRRHSTLIARTRCCAPPEGAQLSASRALQMPSYQEMVGMSSSTGWGECSLGRAEGRWHWRQCGCNLWLSSLWELYWDTAKIAVKTPTWYEKEGSRLPLRQTDCPIQKLTKRYFCVASNFATLITQE